MTRREVGDYALLWANGKSFREIYELMKADIQVETLEWKAAQDAERAGIELNYMDGSTERLEDDPTYRPCRCGCTPEPNAVEDTDGQD